MLTRYREGSKDFVSVYGPGDYRVWVEDRSTGKIYWTSRGANGKILREYEVTGNGGTWKHIRDFLYGAEGIVASVDHDGTEIYYHSDHLGTPRLKTSASGGPFSYHHYYPYGLEAEDFGLVFEDGFESADLIGWEKDKNVLSVKYTGHQRERYKNLDYMLGRHYIFVTNRFASVDPARDGWNHYTYVGNNPLSNTDPSGLAEFDCVTNDGFFLGLKKSAKTLVGLGKLAYNEIVADPRTNPPSIFGQGCDDIVSFAFGPEAGLGAILGGSVNMTIIPPQRVEVTLTLGFTNPGEGFGGVVGLSSGKSKGFGVGGQALAGVGIVGTVQANTSSGGPSAFAGVGIGQAIPAVASGGFTYTWVFYDKCAN